MSRQGAAASSSGGRSVRRGSYRSCWVGTSRLEGWATGVDLGSVLGEWLGWEADSEALDQLGHAVGVHLK